MSKEKKREAESLDKQNKEKDADRMQGPWHTHTLSHARRVLLFCSRRSRVLLFPISVMIPSMSTEDATAREPPGAHGVLPAVGLAFAPAFAFSRESASARIQCRTKSVVNVL